MPQYPRFSPGQTQDQTAEVCVNPDCPGGQSKPHFKSTGKPGRSCGWCGQPMRVLKAEPRG